VLSHVLKPHPSQKAGRGKYRAPLDLSQVVNLAGIAMFRPISHDGRCRLWTNALTLNLPTAAQQTSSA